jgi:hypothetical protein
MPMSVQRTRRLAVSGDERNKLAIIRMQVAIPAGATNHTAGVRKERFAFGVVTLKIMIPRHTATKARSVPTDTSSAKMSSGNAAAKRAANAPVRIVPRYGVRNLGWIFENALGRKPSRAME